MSKLLRTLIVLSVSAPLQAATFTVDSTGDEPDAAFDGSCATAGGACTLRAALAEANGAVGPHTIEFDIPGSGPHTIVLGSGLPIINRDDVTIDGYTQPGAQPNTNSTGPLNTVLQVELTSANANCIQILSNDVVVRGLAVYGCGSGLAAVNGFGAATSGVKFEGNFIGTDASGMTALPNNEGIVLGFSQGGSMSVTVGGSTPAARNLIAGNNTGIVTSSNINGTITATIQGNLIGLDAEGGPLPNSVGIHLQGGGGDPTSATIGGDGPGEANEIAWNTTIGVSVPSSTSFATIRGNSIHDNGGLGIDLGGNGVTANDAGDVDTGPSDYQNFPIVSSVEHLGPQGAGSTRVVGALRSQASTAYTLDFYANPPCAQFPREFLEGETYLGSTDVVTDASGAAPFDVTLPVATPAGARIAATATNPAGWTSEFSQRIIFSVSTASGPASGGTNLTVTGTDFTDPTAITFEGVPAASVTFNNPQSLSVTSPALDPGTVYDITATTSDGLEGTLASGWVADFLDVPGSHQFYSFVTTLVSNTITVGVGGGNYGVDQPTLRRQMAVFLLKAKHGLCYTPPPCQGDFLDVLCPSTFADWIEALADEGISGGCGGGNFCPTNAVRRDQMAPFLLKAEHGSSYVPPACQGVFADVACPSLFADWIEQLAAEQITGGCGGGNYCPLNNSTRGQMAVFVTKTFNLQ